MALHINTLVIWCQWLSWSSCAVSGVCAYPWIYKLHNCNFGVVSVCCRRFKAKGVEHTQILLRHSHHSIFCDCYVIQNTGILWLWLWGNTYLKKHLPTSTMSCLIILCESSFPSGCFLGPDGDQSLAVNLSGESEKLASKKRRWAMQHPAGGS